MSAGQPTANQILANETLSILGCGTIGQAVVAGLLLRQALRPEQIVVSTRRREGAQRLHERYGIEATTDNVEAARRGDIVVVSLKPQRVHALLREPKVVAALAGKLVISVAAGIRLETLAQLLPDSMVARAMPNTPCRVGQGATVVATPPDLPPEQTQRVHQIFGSIGRSIDLEEKHMDAVTSLSGSGPAFVYVVLEAMADAGVMIGLPRDVSLELAAGVCRGAATMVLETGAHPAALKDQVTTPAGSTIAGLLALEDGRIRSVLARAIEEATRVASRLGDPEKP